MVGRRVEETQPARDNAPADCHVYVIDIYYHTILAQKGEQRAFEAQAGELSQLSIMQARIPDNICSDSFEMDFRD